MQANVCCHLYINLVTREAQMYTTFLVNVFAVNSYIDLQSWREATNPAVRSEISEILVLCYARMSRVGMQFYTTGTSRKC